MPPALPRAPEWICAFTAQRAPPISDGAVDRLLRAVRHAAARDGDAEAGEQLLGLVFVDVHVTLVGGQLRS